MLDQTIEMIGIAGEVAAQTHHLGTGKQRQQYDGQRAPVARQMTGIQLHGDAYTWWDQADGRYARSSQPVPGGVLVFRRGGRLASGHVSVVRRVVSAREISVTQANWVRRRITRDEPVVDVSPGNDWSAVRVWWAPTGSLGVSHYPTYGFIAPGRSGPLRSGVVASLDPVMR